LPSADTRQNKNKKKSEKRAHGKILAECHTRQREHDKILAAKEVFAECIWTFAECRDTRQSMRLPSAYDIPYDTDVIT
jgi:hypothetical protein